MKGNLFLGFGRKSVGDVVFYRRKGSTEQMARARNRNPHNPKTDKQLFQRAIMATVLQAYSAGKAIFDHSFEGKALPDGSMNRFMTLNLRRLREAVAYDLSSEEASETMPGRVVPPGATTPVPFAYRISEGTYANRLLTFDNTTPGSEGFKFPAPDAADTTPALYLSNHGFVPGDIYTIVAFGVDPGVQIGDYSGGDFYASYFGWARLEVRADAPTVGNVTIANCFNITTNQIFDYANKAPGTVFTVDGLFDRDQIARGSIGAIRSRYDSGVRSTSDMYMVGAGYFGIVSEDILEAWRAGTQQVGDPELILEGGGSSQPRTTPTPIAPSGDVQTFADPDCSQYATGNESKVYVRFNNLIDPSTPPSTAGFVGAFDGNVESKDIYLESNGSAFYIQVWGSNWQSAPFAQITQGLVVEALNPSGTTLSTVSTTYTWTGGD